MVEYGRIEGRGGTTRVTVTATSILALLAMTGQAQAQESGAPAPAPAAPAAAEAPAEAQSGGIEDIVVTARKRVETTQDVPVSVTALGAAQIERYDLSNLERVAATTPQFVIGRSPSGSGATLVLRGIGSNTTSIGLEQSVAVVVDSVYYGQGRIINEGFFDLGRIEILKGPQALFFGKNATAGVVSISTADPTDKPEYQARLGYEFRTKNLIGEAIASGPLTDTLSARLAIRASKMWGGYFDNEAVDQTYTSNDRTSTAVPGTPTVHASPAAANEVPGTRDLLARLTLKWEPIDDLTVTLKGSIGDVETNSPSSNSVIYRCLSGTYQFNPNQPCEKKFNVYQNRFPTAIADSIPYGKDGGDLGNDYRSWQITGTINYEMDDLTLTSVTNYNWNRNVFVFDADSGSSSVSAASVFATEWSEFHAFSTEFRALTTYDGPVNLMAGAYYQNTKRDYLAWTASGGLENSAAPDPSQRYLANSKDSQTKGETIAAFGQVIWQVVPEVEVAAGVRYTHETKDSYFVQPYSHPIRVAQGIFLPNVTINADQTFNNWSPEATITYKPTDDITLYGAYKTAYKSGGFSNSGILSPSASVEDFAFDPEKAEGFEGGVKTMLFDRQLRLNVGAYWYKYTNLQLDFFRSDIFAFSTINAGSATTKGIELEFQYAPRTVDGLDVHGSINYNKARYGNSPNSPCYQGATPAQGCTIVPGQGPRQNLDGLPTAMAPLWTGSLGVSYETALTDNFNFAVSVDGRYSDDYLTSAFGNEFTRQGSYVNLDASVRVRTADDQWELALIGKNLTNHFYATGGTDAPSTGSGTGTPGGRLADQIGFIAMPRTVQLQLTWKY
ncbi:TonB-dependent receptor [Sphingomonas sp. DBB INV C78]|uniref:TonB-dependent receptor n=1 Tax=Sphingomonas sp. DBB INV C78 TaxID=3349434 RepID=UPI0036D2766C